MNKAILISIRPEWVVKILNGEKTIEIRKTAPKCNLPIDVYIYCTKQIPSFTIADTPNGVMCLYPYFPDGESRFGGKVVAKFTLRNVEKVIARDWGENSIFHRGIMVYELESMRAMCILKEETCLNYDQINSYLDGAGGYAWHISDLVIFDNPVELEVFGLKRPPQSWQYV